MPGLPSILDLARQRVVVFDGAMGTSIHAFSLDLARDWLGHENCSEILTLTRPGVIGRIHESFLEVGCDCVQTNTFGANKIVLGEFGLAHRTFEINKAAAELARAAARRFSTPSRPRYVVASIGPGTKLLTLGHTTWDAMEESYHEQVRGLIAGGVDGLRIETCQDLLQAKCAVCAATRAMNQAGVKLPLFVQVSMDTNNRMLLGTDMSAVAASLLPYDQVDALGLNCATGPAEMGEHVQYLAHHWPRLISVQPNAGIPRTVDGKAVFPLSAGDFAAAMMHFVRDYGVNFVGGCCGTTPDHLRALIAELEGSGFRAQGSGEFTQGPDSNPKSKTQNPKSRPLALTSPQVASLYCAEDIRQDNSYLIIAERTNTNGSRMFRQLLEAGDWDGLVSMARQEVRDGSHVLDLCVDFVGRDGVEDMRQVVRRFVQQIEAPLMLDSTSPAVMEAGLQLAGGRCILNSMNLEEGEERVATICALARKYGAAVVAGTIDEDKQSAMARTAERKLAVAQRLYDLAVGRHGLKPPDIFFDPLVLPISTGVEVDRRNALETIEGIRRIAARFPDCHTVVGLSNVSFGLKPEARLVLNSAFLHECRGAGLTAAIVHASRLLPQNRIGPEQWDAAMDLIYDRRRDGLDPLTRFISLVGERNRDGSYLSPVRNTAENRDENRDGSHLFSVEDALKRHIVDGEKRDLTAHLDEALKAHSPLDIINHFLLDGMRTVGQLFASGQMQLPFVLQSAETMKAAVAHLQPHMQKVQGLSKGRIVLATVRGDVHDIGKNLVDIILSNNGYTVHNLGIKQPIGDILKAARDHRAHAIGMSGLLVKSVAVMGENLQEMNAQGIRLPVLLGGAALTRDYAEEDLAGLYEGPLLYCKDAFAGLAAMDAIALGRVDEEVAHRDARAERRRRLRAAAAKPSSTEAAPFALVRDNPIPTPPFWGRRLATDIPLERIFPFINELALFRGQWGFKQGRLSPEEFERLTDEKARPVLQHLQRQAIGEGFIQPKVVWGYFPVQSQGDELIVYEPEGSGFGVQGSDNPKSKIQNPKSLLRFSFPRQEGRRRLCIADFFRPVSSGQFDVLGLQLVTVGDQATRLAEDLRRRDRYQEYLYVHGFAVECAEALAEYWHQRMRAELGFAHEDAPDIRQLFQQNYRGSRYSFGYPACPDLEERAKIVQLLRPDEIGVALSESFMLVPEQSTDALVVHHPQAKYFDV